MATARITVEIDGRECSTQVIVPSVRLSKEDAARLAAEIINKAVRLADCGMRYREMYDLNGARLITRRDRPTYLVHDDEGQLVGATNDRSEAEKWAAEFEGNTITTLD